MSVDTLKNQIVENQKIIDELNRKTREIKIIQEISSEINSILNLSQILNSILLSLDKIFHFKHSMILLSAESGEKLKVTASHGYAEEGIGAEIQVGQGIIGVVAKRKKMMRMGNIGVQMAYTNTIRNQFEAAGQNENFQQKVKLPGLKNLQSQVAIPLLVKEKLIGVLAVESETPNVFDERDEVIINIVANQAASAIENARLFQAEKEANENLKTLNENLEEKVIERTVEVVQQKNIIEEKNKNITDSIRYAKRIQDALLPSPNYVNEHLKNNFILFKPKDIVSGDFYWINQKNNKVFFTAIDCTGHGVPGAFVSIVAHGNLQRALVYFGLKTPAEILDKVNEGVVEMFSRDNQSGSIKDGMDVALCALDTQNMKLEFAGANNPLYFIRKGELKEIKGDKQPIGEYAYRKKFTSHVFDVQKDDVIYLFSDGYADQFGGAKGKKFKYAQLKEILISIHEKPMQEQKEILNRIFEEWKGADEQTDDVCIIGVRV